MTDRSYTITRLAELLAEPGLSAIQALNRLRYLVKQDLLHHYGERSETGGKTAPWLYSEAELCKAAVIFALIDAGVADQTALQAADLGMIANHAPLGSSDEEVVALASAERPIVRAIEQVRRDEWPAFILTAYRREADGHIVHFGEIRAAGQNPVGPPTPDYLPRVGMVIELRPLFLRLLRDRTIGH